MVLLIFSFSSKAVLHESRLAILAKPLRGGMMLESVYHRLSSRGVENFFQRLMKEITQYNISIVV